MRQRTPFHRVGADEAWSLVRRDGALVFDVRDAGSFSKARIEGATQLSIANLSDVVAGMARSTPILIYCHHGYASLEYAQIFSDFGFSEVSSLDGGYEAWSQAAREETLEQWLAGHGFPASDVNAVIGNATTPLMRACHGGSVAMVRALIAAGARLETRNADGNNALWPACIGDHLDIIDLLVEAGIDIDNRNDNGATPLMCAASAGKAAVAARLLANGADTSLETLDGFSALDLASTIECLTLLRRATRAGPGPRRPEAQGLPENRQG